MRPLRYAINVSLDGCCDHTFAEPDDELHEHFARHIARADALIYGRITYEMMESAWRPPVQESGMPAWTEPFAQTISAAKKYVVSSTLETVDWTAELVRGDLREAVRRLKDQPGEGLSTGGVRLPLALAELGLIDEYEFVVHPTVVGRGPTLFAGLTRRLRLEPIARREFSGAVVATTYVPRAGHLG